MELEAAEAREKALLGYWRQLQVFDLCPRVDVQWVILIGVVGAVVAVARVVGGVGVGVDGVYVLAAGVSCVVVLGAVGVVAESPSESIPTLFSPSTHLHIGSISIQTASKAPGI